MSSNKTYPKAKLEVVSEKMHGVEVIDHYRWLEDENNPEVQQWVAQQNEFTDQWFEQLDLDGLVGELKEDLDAFSKGTPWREGNTYFWYEREPGQDHYVLFSGSDPNGKKEVVINPNELSSDGSIALSSFSVSKTAKFAVYSLQEGGSEREQVYIRDLKTGKDEEFYFGLTFSMSWCDDERGFYYTRSDYKSHGGDSTDESHYQQVYYHQIGEPRSKDKLVFNAIDYVPKDASVHAHSSEDGRYVFINASLGWSVTKLYLIDAQQEIAVEIMEDIEAVHMGYLMDGYIYLTTNHKANNWQVLRIKVEDAEKPIEDWEVFIPEKKEQKLEGWEPTKSQIIVEYTHNAISHVERIDRKSGKHLGELDLPLLASLGALSTNEDFEEFYFSVSTFFESFTKYRYNSETNEAELFWKDSCSIDSEKFEAEQVWFKSKDGTDIPMFVVGPKQRKNTGETPVVLTGYGGFSIGQYPGFLGDFKPWLQRGGVVAIPNLRGGDEFGEEWHQAGMFEKKQNVFDDMIAAAEYLIDKKVTSPNKLAIRGGSNGGLLVGACITQRPELFGAAVCEVPLLDMLRFNKFLMAQRWTREYGNPEDPDAFKWLKAYSPYHNVRKGKDYPPILLTAGTNDARVHPLHAWKMAARLQSLKPKNAVLLRTETKAGHGSGKGFYQWLHDHAERLAFIMHNLNVSI